MIQYEVYVKYNWIIESLNHWIIESWIIELLEINFEVNSSNIVHFVWMGIFGNDEFIEIDWIVSIFELNCFLEVKSNQVNVWFLDCMIILLIGILG